MARKVQAKANSKGNLTIEELATELRVTIIRLGRRVLAERVDDSLGLTEMTTLVTLNRLGPLSPSAIAEVERIAAPSVTRTITSLEGMRLVVRRAHPTDGRQSVVRITPAGRRVIQKNRELRSAWLSTALRSASVDDRALLHNALTLLQRIYDT
jgi:DNA-binding MarR family transcriptional regulator